MPEGRLHVYNTKAVAKRLNIHSVSILRWIEAGKFKAPQRVTPNHFVWHDDDIERLKAFIEKFFYRGLDGHIISRTRKPQGQKRP